MGLTTEQALKLKEEGKYNGNVKAGTKTVGEILFDNIFTFFNAVNLVAAIFVFTTGSYKNMTFMFVCFWNAIVGIFQEMKARRTLTKLKILLNPVAFVIRDDKEIQIKSDDIVYGDTCVFYAGDQVCVDGKVIEGEGFVNESLLTGESIPVPKKKDDNVLAGTFVAEGKLIVEATGVGEESYTYKIIKRAKKFKKNRSEIMYSINYVIRLVTLFVIPVATALILKQHFVSHDSYNEIVLSTVAATIGFIPSGFVLLTSLVMFKGAIKLSFYNTLVQDLYSTEKLARVDTICFDKTGTLTKGRFDVTKIVEINCSRDEFEKALKEYSNTGFDRNSTILSIRAYYSGKDYNWNFIDGIPFSSARKWSLLEFKEGTYVLGAPDVLLSDKEKFNSKYNQEMVHGARIIAFGKCESYDKDKETFEGFSLMGLVILKDTLRDNAKETIEFLDSQKLNIKVISGDNPLTASIVATEAGIKDADKYIDASSIDSIEDIKEAVDKYTVFGRVTPEFKLKFVRALQEQEHIVAMTGDGVNDVMALKEADCSIAMQSGSSAARDISSVVLLDSDFAHIPEIIREGRRSINNLERSGVLYLTKTVYAILLALLFIVIPYSYPFKPIQYTLLGTLTIGYPSFFLAFEPNDERVRTGFLYNILFKAIPNGALVATNVCLSALMVYIWLRSELTLSTMATLTTGLVSMFIFTDLCRPFTRLRFWVTVLVPIVFWTVLLILPDVFDVMGITLMRFYGSVVILSIDFVIYLFYRMLTRKFFNKDKFRARITNWLNKKARRQAKM
ncbi:HAD-IC family P-type ATPase [uncultured Eubacterium sp.]|uniref:HAD-IC family P-type ATPase n=1 Tax=uncultured Eubacterium sp. TaxID=165185 RepID=UPI0025927A2F|nr:HAD-IC family P-type ATPase [uncultured Eubacterium sp.]